MPVSFVNLDQTKMAVTAVGEDSRSDMEFVWAHGWGQSGAAFMHLAEAFARQIPSRVLDLPGFGESDLPPEGWGTAEYADAIAGWLATLPAKRRIWVGHSFGCRVGIQLAARHPGLVDAMILVAAAGLPRRRTAWQRLRLSARVYAFKVAKALTKEGPARERLYARVGSADARSAGPMRGVFVRAVNEDLAEVAARVDCKTLLLYGRDDVDTPPEIGERLQRLIRDAELHVLNGFDHHTILTLGRHQVVSEIRRFLAL